MLYQADLTPPAYLFAKKQPAAPSTNNATSGNNNQQKVTSAPETTGDQLSVSPTTPSQPPQLVPPVEHEDDSLKSVPCIAAPVKLLDDTFKAVMTPS